MGTHSRKKWVFAAAAALLMVAGVLGSAYYVRRPRLTPALRGYDLAKELGCFACHGPGGTGGVPNPGSDVQFVPAWDGGNAMMYVENEREIHEWIVYGYPKRLEHKYGISRSEDTNAGATKGRNRPLLDMPAYGEVVSESDLEDLVAYYRTVATFGPMPKEARDGYNVASRLGCFGCHGPGGRVGVKNPASFKGYIPPWQGDDFDELVNGEDELRQWILEGVIDRFESNPFARFFTKRQIINMPAYKEVVEDDELEAIVDYIVWLQEE